jgi:CheY-like chemotaxis protein
MSLGPPAVLVVEDNPDDVFLIERAFAESGTAAAIKVVDDGEKAIAYLSGRGSFADREKFPVPSLVLLDLKLPRIPGLNVLSWLRKQPALGRMLVVILTSSRESIDINRAYELGANSYLVKPVSSEALAELIKSVDRYWLGLNEQPDVRP